MKSVNTHTALAVLWGITLNSDKLLTVSIYGKTSVVDKIDHNLIENPTSNATYFVNLFTQDGKVIAEGIDVWQVFDHSGEIIIKTASGAHNCLFKVFAKTKITF